MNCNQSLTPPWQNFGQLSFDLCAFCVNLVIYLNHLFGDLIHFSIKREGNHYFKIRIIARGQTIKSHVWFLIVKNQQSCAAFSVLIETLPLRFSDRKTDRNMSRPQKHPLCGFPAVTV